MHRTIIAFIGGLALGSSVVAGVTAFGQASAPARTSVAQLRLYTIDKGRLDDFAAAWRAGVYPLRTRLGYRIPFAAKIPSTNQFVWLLMYAGPESWEQKEAAYYASDDRKRLSPDPAQWIARPEQLMVDPVIVDAAAARFPVGNSEAELAALEQALVKSVVGGDRATYSAILDPDWRTIDTLGRVRAKADVLEQLFAGPSPIADGTIDAVSVRLFGDAAVVTGRTTATPRAGATIVLRFTDVFIRRDGRWQVVASQGTRIAP